jgi:hypothetical protein
MRLADQIQLCIEEVIMQQAWNVIWFQDKKKYIKSFEGELPRVSGAVDYAKKLRKRGIVEVFVTSRRKAFAPPLAKKEPPQSGLLWCPYCLSWREYIYRAIRTNGLVGPFVWRCPICSVSINDYWVKRFNPLMVEVLDARNKVHIPSEKLIRRRRGA